MALNLQPAYLVVGPAREVAARQLLAAVVATKSVYWDGTKATTTATSNTFIGHAVEAAANPSATGLVRLSI